MKSNAVFSLLHSLKCYTSRITAVSIRKKTLFVKVPLTKWDFEAMMKHETATC